MSTVKISDLITVTQSASGDYLSLLDVSDTSQGTSGSTRKITRTNFLRGARILPPSGDTLALLINSETDPDPTAKALISIETSYNRKLIFWGSEDVGATTGSGYSRIEFRPERNTGDDESDVQILVHKRSNTSPYPLHQHLSIYTRDAGFTGPTKRLNIDYGVDMATMDIYHMNVLIDDENDTNYDPYNTYFLRVWAQKQQTDSTTAIFEVINDHSSSSQRTVRFINDGTGHNLFIDSNGSGRGIFLDHDDTGSNPSAYIDRDGNNAAKIWGLKIDTDNAGAGGVGGIDLSSFSTGEANFIFVADATDPTGGGGIAAGRVAIDIGGSIKYLAYY